MLITSVTGSGKFCITICEVVRVVEIYFLYRFYSIISSRLTVEASFESSVSATIGIIQQVFPHLPLAAVQHALKVANGDINTAVEFLLNDYGQECFLVYTVHISKILHDCAKIVRVLNIFFNMRREVLYLLATM